MAFFRTLIPSSRPLRRGTCRRGQALVEFAIVAVAMMLILSAIVTFGQVFWVAQGTQTAVDAAAQELARTPFAPVQNLGLGKLTFDSNDVMWTTTFKEQFYDQRHLVVPLSTLGSQTLTTYAASNFPLLNRLLVPYMIYDAGYNGGVYRYPGAIVEYTDPVTGEAGITTVLVPVVDYASNTVNWVSPVEEVAAVDSSSGALIYPFSLASSVTPGMVALRINYPVQSSAFIARTPTSTDAAQSPQSAVDADLAAATTSDYTLVVGDDAYTPNVSGTVDGRHLHGGKYGLGRTFAFAEQAGVRPFRRIVSAQAIYRREVFE